MLGDIARSHTQAHTFAQPKPPPVAQKGTIKLPQGDNVIYGFPVNVNSKTFGRLSSIYYEQVECESTQKQASLVADPGADSHTLTQYRVARLQQAGTRPS